MTRPGLNIIWPTRRDFSGCYVMVPREHPDLIAVGLPAHANGIEVELTRSEAQLLARRLNQCLDATVKR